MPVSIANLPKGAILLILYKTAIAYPAAAVDEPLESLSALARSAKEKIAEQTVFEEVDLGKGSVFLGVDLTHDDVDLTRYNERYGVGKGESLIASLQLIAEERQRSERLIQFLLLLSQAARASGHEHPHHHEPQQAEVDPVAAGARQGLFFLVIRRCPIHGVQPHLHPAPGPQAAAANHPAPHQAESDDKEDQQACKKPRR